jgi:putative hydrolase of the HAD superfamily
MYAAVVFDLFGTLAADVGAKEFEASLADTARVLGCSMKDLAELWCTEQGFVRSVTGQENCRRRIEMTCDHLGIVKTEERISAAVQSRLRAHREWLEPLPTAVEALSALRHVGMRLGLMSVCSDEVPALWGETLLARLFDSVLFSCQLGYLKSDPQFFCEACHRLNVHPNSAMYVGDSEDELRTAMFVGMSPVLMRTGKEVHWNGKAVDHPIDMLPIVLDAQNAYVQQVHLPDLLSRPGDA